MKHPRSRAVAAAFALGALFAATHAGAQGAPPCGPNEVVAPWMSANVGIDADGATSAPDATQVRLCSAALGLDVHRDQYRVATQPMPGDFHLQALLVSLDPGGSAGLIAVGPNRHPDSARLAIEARTNAVGGLLVRSSIRRGAGAAAEAWTEDFATTLPALLRIRRVGTMIRTEIEDASGLQIQLTADVSDSELAALLHAGLFQASADSTTHRQAVFGRFDISAPPLPPEIECVEPRALIPGTTLTVRGRNLGGIRSADIVGAHGNLISVRDDEVVFQVGDAPRTGLLHGDVFLRGAAGTRQAHGGAAYTGTPFIRGDADGDGEVDREDWNRICYQVYRSQPLECGASGDVDGDGDVDDVDLARLKAFLLAGTAPPPAGPFPEPGYVTGVRSCGLPAGPQIYEVTREDGARITQALSEGDLVVIVGSDLPLRQSATVYFGDVPARVLSDSTAERMRVRIGTVPSAGARCPVIWRGVSHPGETRWGQTFTLERNDARACPMFAASARGLALTSQVRGNRVELAFPQHSYRPGEVVVVDAAMHLPFVDGRTRGPRGVRKEIMLPPGGSNSYADGLAHLASELTKALQGPADDECLCEIEVLPDVPNQKLSIEPCDPPLPGPPKPHLPGLPTQVVAAEGPVVGHLDVTSAAPEPVSCDGEVDVETDPLGWAWCHVAEVLLPPADHEVDFFESYPRFESMTPIQISLDANEEAWQLTPENKPWSQKQTLVDDAVHVQMNQYGYDDGYAYALRSERCGDYPLTEWMPRFRSHGRIVKLFWLAQSSVPNGLDVQGLYSWVPASDGNPNTVEERQYLVGLHVNVARNLPYPDPDPDTYFRWITAWLPLPNNISSPRYHTGCDSGTTNERPLSLANTPFADFVICSPDVSPTGACGNPWAPIDECSKPEDQNCKTCHLSARVSSLNLETGWLFSTIFRKGSDISAAIDELGSQPDLRPNWGGAPLDGIPEAWQDNCSFLNLNHVVPWQCQYASTGCVETPGYPTP